MIDLSIIILTYNTKDITLKCLDHLATSDLGRYQVEVLVVDNASTDGTVESLKLNPPAGGQSEKLKARIKFIGNSINLGFAAGNNKGMRQAKGRYVLLLNSDVMVEKNTLRKQLDFMEQHPDFGVSTCKLLLEHKNPSVVGLLPLTRELDPASHRGFPTPWAGFTYFAGLENLFPKTRWFGQYHQGWKNIDVVHDVDAISGAFFMIRKEVIEKVGLLDEGFFMYAEDLDWCLRIREAGFRIGFNPNIQALHLKGESGRKKVHSSKLKVKSEAEAAFWETMKLFYKKHYEKRYPKLLMWLIFRVIDWKKR